MNVSTLDCLPFDLRYSHTSKVSLDDYKFTLEFDHVVDETEAAHNGGLVLTFALNRQRYKSVAIEGAVTKVTLNNRRKSDMDDFVSHYTLAHYVQFLNSSDEELVIYDIYFKRGGCLVLAEQTVDGGMCGNWVAIQLAVDEVSYQWQ